MIIYYLLITLLSIYEIILLMRVIISWMAMIPRSGFIAAVENMTDPLVLPCRRLIGTLIEAFGRSEVALPFDLSPVMVFMAVHFFKKAFIIVSGGGFQA
ncbi:MAG TPA: YggT family protein [bacterium]|nr:YggT family protein [bacterium]